ncbi:NADH-quinone oxidoreductase subunit M [Xenorhabdus nematophila]|uniref:NADH-quinone oxidoreductase subunit M n=1 Tax=Xenorhabdus nematophila (strain ATCC 19061 / DSM 3370 / CCUG 14189 / LMG 1036 / NCIMB 9965 / AN6) TaxID=406817 RepID=D3VJ19_XENNA|nr:NADH-quinone oxidoreductase subunit M [Xenorhabdus nematophila]CEE90301.1 NADH dehydrogenase I chain M, membrane subunit [Xenorhabdus nematophila str. Anatoliense]CEF28444.1 NADH dehydrogenase I chain M, membrane subunit [Xenorhabdus nematophila str. Websteri]AYA39866.1 NADH-quinone oxidoreductase subunit M [Xenorhabdus nematophila]MBA0018432.1 NADH-quinone oxidoreductase subunit M [Xenorhabdus nematophila]MCB4425082.1 NADH-quinone oxidoreductase subunit M [Xenorhabdus nematophila]
MLLPWLIFLPFIGGLLCWQSERFGTRMPRWIALLAMGLTLLLSLQLWLQGGYTLTNPQGIPQWQSEFILPWIPRFGISIHLALDGLSLLMVVLTALLGLMAILCSWNENQPYQGFFHLNLLWILGGVMGVFLAIDLFLFFFFWEVMLVPMYFLIALWGHRGSEGKTRITAATKFFIYTQASGLVMLIAILALAFVHHNATGEWSFNYETLLNTPMSYTVQYLLMLGFFIAFAVKMPVVPLHGWLPDAHSQAPTAGSVDLAGILLKTAAYGLLRFSLPLFPEASANFAPIAMWLGVIGIFYGAWMAFSQTDIKRLIAYTSVSHMGFVLIAIYTGSQLAYQGAVIQMIAHGLSAAGLFILCGQLYERLHTRDMRQMGGLWSRIQLLPAISLFFAVATLGMPGTGNFVGEFMILFGSFSHFTLITTVSVFGLVFASVYALYLMQKAYYGTPKTDKPLPQMDAREISTLLLLVVLLVLLGVYPQPILDTSAAAMSNIQNWYSASLLTTRP